MKVDVLMPTYNRREFLPKAIDSFLRQTFKDWRLIVVNDGGEDVADIVAAANDPRVVYFRRPHAGKAAQLNFALAKSAAKYIAYMDDDDEVFPEHLERLVSAAERLGSDLVYSDTWLTILDESGKVVYRSPENEADTSFEDIRLVNRLNHKQILHTRELSDRVGPYDENLKILIDFDYIKRLLKVAAAPFHLRAITGEHYLRMSGGVINSISGLWIRDPAAAGRSLLSFFEKDPEALAMLMKSNMERGRESETKRPEKKPGFLMRVRNIFAKRKNEPADEPAAARDALPPAVAWRETTPPGGLDGFMVCADETVPEIAAVNRIAALTPRAEDRSLMTREEGMPFSTPAPRFMREASGNGARFVSADASPMRWVMLTSREMMPEDFAIEFTYIPHTVFKEQLQFDFAMRSLGERLRFMVRDNERLAYSRVRGGLFAPDIRRLPFSFEMDRAYQIRFESAGGVRRFMIDGVTRFSLAAPSAPGFVALVFYDTDAAKTIDFEIRDLRCFLPGDSLK